MNFLLKMKVKLIQIFLKILFSPLTPVNAYFLEKYGNQKIAHQPIFIIGAPRTGSTILYQALTNQSKVLYFDNLVCRLNHIIFIGFWLSQKLFKNKPHNSFRSNFGNTAKNGLHAPSECGDFWYRWLPKNKHFIDFNDLENIDYEQIRKEITAITNYWNKPVVFKNLNAGQRMRLIKLIFPNARFIFITREPFFVAQSILEAKRKLKIADNQFWSIMPKNVEELKTLDWANQIVGQIFYLEKQILIDSELFEKDNFIKIEYTELSDVKILKLINLLKLEKRNKAVKPLIVLSEKVRLSSKESALLVKAINVLSEKSNGNE